LLDFLPQEAMDEKFQQRIVQLKEKLVEYGQR